MPQRTFETVDNPGTPLGQCCLALDRDGNPAIAYAAADGNVMFARRMPAGWSREVVSAARVTPSDGTPIRLDIDPQGDPHIAFKDMESGHLAYGVKRDGFWSIRQVPTKLVQREPGGITGYDFRLHFRNDTPELQNTAHFVYHDPTTGQLGYTRWINGEFTLVTAAAIHSGRRNGFAPSIAFDYSTGAFRLTFVEITETSGSAMPQHSQVWTRLIVNPFDGTLGEPFLLDEGQFNINRPTSTAGDGLGFCAVFADFEHRRMVACFTEQGIPDPIRHVFDTGGSAVAPSVARTVSGGYRIAYCDDGRIKLASYDSALPQWAIETIEAGSALTPSLAYERFTTKAHLAYWVNGSVRYASWAE